MGVCDGCLYVGHRLGCWFRKDPHPIDGPGLEEAIDEIGKLSCWMWTVFLLVSLPGIFNMWALLSNVFQARQFQYWCDIAQVEKSNWTDAQKQTIVSGVPSPTGDPSCNYLDHDYDALTKLSYDDALAVTKNTTAKEKKCDKFKFERPEDSIVGEWSLVCVNTYMKSTLLMLVSLGKFFGALIFGTVADKYGRKRSVVIASVMYMVFGPMGAFNCIYSFGLVRFVQGFAGVGLFNCGFTILMEVCQERHRVLLGILFNMSYALGMSLLPLIGWYFPNWQHMQLAFSLPCVFLIFSCWIVPESPRWLQTHNKRSDAWKVVMRCKKSLGDGCHPIAPGTQSSEAAAKVEEAGEKKSFRESLGVLFSIISTNELRLRVLLCCYLWFALAFCYYAIGLNATNFGLDIFLYIAVGGVIEALGYILPVFILRVLGRCLTCGGLFLISGISLFCILIIPSDMTYVTLTVAMVSKLGVGAAYSVVVLLSSELFPTENRGTAIGACSMWTQVGTLITPYTVDLLGQKNKSIPGTMCATLSIGAFFVSLLLPETKGRVLANTVDDVKASPDKVSLNCFRFCKKSAE